MAHAVYLAGYVMDDQETSGINATCPLDSTIDFSHTPTTLPIACESKY